MRNLKTFVVQYLEKRRKQRRMPLLKFLLLLSVLLSYLPSQISTTYGEFTSSSDTSFTFSTCNIFPDEINDRLLQIHAHLKNASAIKNNFQSLNASTIRFITSASLTPAPTAPPSHETLIPLISTATEVTVATTSHEPVASATSATYRNADMDSPNSFNQDEHESAAESISLQITLLQESNAIYGEIGRAHV